MSVNSVAVHTARVMPHFLHGMGKMMAQFSPASYPGVVQRAHNVAIPLFILLFASKIKVASASFFESLGSALGCSLGGYGVCVAVCKAAKLLKVDFILDLIPGKACLKRCISMLSDVSAEF